MLEADPHGQPADEKRHHRKRHDAGKRQRNIAVQTAAAGNEQGERGDNVNGTEHETEGAAEAADNLVRIGLDRKSVV